MISAIVAMTYENVIGKGNSLPWSISEEMQFFRRKTNDSIVIMGSNTYKSIGKPLKNRLNVVLTKQNIEGVTTFDDITKAILYSQSLNLNKPIFIIGGLKLYQEALDKKLIDELYVSYINTPYEGDVKFPEFEHLFKYKTLVEEHLEFNVWKFYGK